MSFTIPSHLRSPHHATFTYAKALAYSCDSTYFTTISHSFGSTLFHQVTDQPIDKLTTSSRLSFLLSFHRELTLFHSLKPPTPSRCFDALQPPFSSPRPTLISTRPIVSASCGSSSRSSSSSRPTHPSPPRALRALSRSLRRARRTASWAVVNTTHWRRVCSSNYVQLCFRKTTCKDSRNVQRNCKLRLCTTAL